MKTKQTRLGHRFLKNIVFSISIIIRGLKIKNMYENTLNKQDCQPFSVKLNESCDIDL